MTQKKQWLLFGAILGVGTLATWALVRWGGLAEPAPKVPEGPVVVNPGNGGAKPPAAPPQAKLPFNNGRGAGGAAVPNFGGGTAGGAATPFGNGGQTAGAGKLPFGANNTVASNTPFGNTVNTAGGAAVPSFGAGGAAGGAKVPFAANNAVASATPFDNKGTGGAGVPSFGSGGAAGGAGLPAAGAGTGGAMVPMFTRDVSDANATAKYYLRQICGDRVPTLADWQKLVDMKLADADKWLHAPMGAGHFVMAMCLDQQNNLFVGTEGEGLFRFSTADGMWTQFVATKNPPPDGNPPIPASATVCGMGDNYVYALACDHQGRVWAGHLNHGVSVFNGEKWANYEVVGGLSRPDTLSGPLGERLFHITVCPETATGKFKDPLTDKESAVAGSTWMCTSAGLAIHFLSTDTWSYLTRADGLPSDQANSLAFDKDGTVFVATSCDGIAIAGPKDGYKVWKQVARRANGSIDGPLSDELPTTPTGTGLPTNLINDILVTKDGTVYAATTAGLAWSTNKGDSWRFVRGADYAAKVRGRIGGAPTGWTEEKGAILSEDYCTSLSIDGSGNLHLGHRTAAGDVIFGQGHGLASTFAADYALCVLAMPNSDVSVVGMYGGGLGALLTRYASLSSLPGGDSQLSTSRAPVVGQLRMPSGALNPTQVQLDALAKIAPSSNSGGIVTFLADDWTTQGDWVGRYGRHLAVLCGAGGASDHLGAWGTGYKYAAMMGPNKHPEDIIRGWIATNSTSDPRALYDVALHKRCIAEYDDHGEAYARTIEGPDICVTLTIPRGVNVISFYFFNNDGHSGKNRQRDLQLDVWKTGSRDIGVSRPPLAQSRVHTFWNGVYKRILITQPDTYSIHINRNYSLNATLMGIFVDRVDPEGYAELLRPPPGMLGVRYGPPSNKLPITDPVLLSAQDLWNSIQRATAKGIPCCTLALALRAAYGHSAPADLLTEWRWRIPLWTETDRKGFTEAMEQGRSAEMRRLENSRQFSEWRQLPNRDEIPFTYDFNIERMTQP